MSVLLYFAVGIAVGGISGVFAAKKKLRYFTLGLLIVLLVTLTAFVISGEKETSGLDLWEGVASIVGYNVGHYVVKSEFEKGQ